MRKDKKHFVMESAENVKPTIVFWKTKEVYESGKRMFFLQGSSRSGKTYNFIIWLCYMAHQATEPIKFVIVRRTMPNLKKTVFKDFKEVMMRLGIWEPQRMNNANMEYEFDNGCTVGFFATEDYSVAQGLKSDILFINEATELERTVWDQLIMRCTRFIAIDYNPNFSDEHWIKKEIINPLNADRMVLFKTTYKDNPFLSPEQVADIEKYKYTDPRHWRIYGLGEQALVEGLVYESYDRLEHFPAEYENSAFIGIDWGYKDPFAVVKMYADQRAHRLYVEEMCYKSLLSEDEQMAVLLRPDIRPMRMVCDSSAPQFIARCRQHGLRIRGAVKNSSASAHSITPGISAVQSYRIVVCGDSPNIEMEIGNYTYRQDRNGNYTNVPIDKFNHLMDAIRYGVYTLSPSKARSNRVVVHR